VEELQDTPNSVVTKKNDATVHSKNVGLSHGLKSEHNRENTDWRSTKILFEKKLVIIMESF